MNVSPSVLQFSAPFTQQSTQILKLENKADEALAFKVKTTAPRLYCVRPNAAVIAPGQSLEVSIISQGLKEEPTPGFKCKDKFLVVSVPCPYDTDETPVSDMWPNLENEFKDRISSERIRVQFLIEEPEVEPEAPVVAEKTEEPKPDLEREVSESNAKVEEMDKELDATQQEKEEPPVQSTASTVSPQQQPQGGFSMSLAVKLILVAILIGWYFK